MLVGVLLVSDDGSDWCVIYNQIGLFNYQIGHIDTNRIQIGIQLGTAKYTAPYLTIYLLAHSTLFGILLARVYSWRAPALSCQELWH